MKANLGSLDRATRQTVGIMMCALGLSGVVTGVRGMVLIGLGALLMITGTFGRCLLYRALGWNTVAAPSSGPATPLSATPSSGRSAPARNGG
jgi:hypothetical protein